MDRMASLNAAAVLSSWETVRFELLNTRLCDLGLHIPDSPVEPFIDRLFRELNAKKIDFRPQFYLTDGWGCPDQVPIIGIPFYLTDKQLGRLEEEQTGVLEDDHLTMMLLRHEMGHAINYAYKLWEHEGWTETFGKFHKPYRDTFQPNPFSREYVRHLVHHRYGRTYAQKHPDEDFAETFAVWLTPRSCWRRKYRTWPALKKLKYVDKLIKRIREESPLVTDGNLCQPLEELTVTLAEHYGQRAERYRSDAQGYVDDKLHEVFPDIDGNGFEDAATLIEKHQDMLLNRVCRWSELEADEVEAILEKLRDRAEVLDLKYEGKSRQEKIIDLAALVSALAVQFAYTGRLTG
jgi:hypothetical protein